jgi:hypothetical protein
MLVAGVLRGEMRARAGEMLAIHLPRALTLDRLRAKFYRAQLRLPE